MKSGHFPTANTNVFEHSVCENKLKDPFFSFLFQRETHSSQHGKDAQDDRWLA